MRVRGIIKLLPHIQLLLTDIWKTWAITNQYDGLLPELYKIATWSPGSSTCMCSKPQKACTNCVAVVNFFFNLEEMCGSISNTFTLNYKPYKGHTICKGPPVASLSCLNAWVNSNSMLKVEKAYFMWEVHFRSDFYHQKLACFPNILELMLHWSKPKSINLALSLPWQPR